MNSAPWGIALGFFDGVHVGHRRLIEELCKKGQELNLKTKIFTFKQHPVNVITPANSVPLIYSPQQRHNLLCGLGVDTVEMIDFDINMSRMTPEDFCEDILFKKQWLQYGVVGFNYRFGQGGSGDAHLLKGLAAKKGIRIDIIEPVRVEEQLVSSSYVRQLLIQGNMEKANLYLGRNYTISGRVIKGRGRGNDMGVPTANLKLMKGLLHPARGVYFTNTMIDKTRYKSITNIGIKPTFNDKTMGIETFICGLNKDIYGRHIRIEFLKRIRDEKKFGNRESLKRQIELDMKEMGNYFYKN